MSDAITGLKLKLDRRLRFAFGLLRGIRFQSRLCRSSPREGTERDHGTGTEAARWLGNIGISGRSHHALFCPPGREVRYRLLAPPRSRLVAWCGLLSDATHPTKGGAEFVITAHVQGTSIELIERLRLDPQHSRRDTRWRKLVLELRNREPQHIELTFAIHADRETRTDPWAIWGEPRLEWRRPLAEISALMPAVARPVLRGRLIVAARTLRDQLAGSSSPSMYREWLTRRASTPEDLARMRVLSDSFGYRPLVSVVTPVYNTDSRWLRACIESVKNQAYPYWQLCLADDGSTRPETRKVLLEYQDDPRIRIHMLPANAGIAAASNAGLSLAEGDFVAFLDHDDEIAPDALFEVVARLNDTPGTDLIYTDEDKLELDGSRSGPYFKPDWSHEHFLTNMYTCHLMVVRRTVVERVGGFRDGYEGAQDYDLVLRLIEQTTRIQHVPKVLYHWRRIPESTAGGEGAKPWAHDAGKRALQDYLRRNRLDAEIQQGGFPFVYRVRFAIHNAPFISILLPAVPDWDALDEEGRQRCESSLRTLAERTTYRRFEVVLPTTDDHGHERVTAILRDVPCRPVRMESAAVPCSTGAAAAGFRPCPRRSAAVSRLGTACAR